LNGHPLKWIFSNVSPFTFNLSTAQKRETNRVFLLKDICRGKLLNDLAKNDIWKIFLSKKSPDWTPSIFLPYAQEAVGDSSKRQDGSHDDFVTRGISPPSENLHYDSPVKRRVYGNLPLFTWVNQVNCWKK
jgi:hypothetical protein